MVSPIHTVLGKLPDAKQTKSGWTAKCPGHDDSSPSLDVALGKDDCVLLTCRAGCDGPRIVKAMGLELRDLFARQEREERRFEVRGVDGRLVATHVRIDHPEFPKPDPRHKRLFWKRDGASGLGGLKVEALPLYGSELLPKRAGEVWIAEGEPAADALRRLGLLGLGTVTGAASAPGRAVLEALRDRDVILWPDNDTGGAAHMRRIATTLDGIASSVRTLTWPAAPPKGDAADYVAQGGDLESLDKWLGPVGPDEPADSGLPPRLCDVMRQALAGLDRFAAGDFSDCAPTGIPTLDRMLGGGLRAGQVTLLGAVTGGGKTTVAQQIAATTAAQRGAVLFVSPEMSVEDLAVRELLRRSGAALWQRSPWKTLPAETRERAAGAHRKAADELEREALPIHVLDLTAVTMADIEEKAGMLKRGPGLALVVIDYAQQVAEVDPRTPRYLAVGEVAQRSVALARELAVPVLICSQVNVIKEGQRTSYSFRESAILEHKAHNVLILAVTWQEDGRGFRVIESAEFVAQKNRSGPLFTLPVKYDPELFRLSAVEDSHA